MTLKHLLFLGLCAVVLWVPQLIPAQGILCISNTNQPIAGTTEELYGARAAFVTGFNPYGYELTGISIAFGGNAGTDYTNITVRLYESNYPLNLDSEVSTMTVPTPVTAGIYFYPWPTNFFLLGQQLDYGTIYYEFAIFAGNNANGYIDQSLNVAYTTSTNYAANAGWTFLPEDSPINGTLGICPVVNIFATVVPPPVLYPIHLKDIAALPDGSFQFGFTNSPGLNFTTYATTNTTLSFTNEFNVGNPVNVASNYYQYNSGPGVVTSPMFPHVYFRVSSP
jgi:hypothetical protein